MAINGVSTFIFAYAGTPAYFSIAAEMRDPREYNRALVLSQSFVTAFYLTVGIVVYYYAGSFVSSPAPGTAGPILKKASYGFAIPGLMASNLLFIHVSPPSHECKAAGQGIDSNSPPFSRLQGNISLCAHSEAHDT